MSSSTLKKTVEKPGSEYWYVPHQLSLEFSMVPDSTASPTVATTSSLGVVVAPGYSKEGRKEPANWEQ